MAFTADGAAVGSTKFKEKLLPVGKERLLQRLKISNHLSS